MVSDNIERFLKDMFHDQTSIEVKRNELAHSFGCAPSQINYVLTTRFSIDHGYMIKSKRGGGGYILIIQLAKEDAFEQLLHCEIGKEISEIRAKNIICGLVERGCVTFQEAKIMHAAIEQVMLAPKEMRESMRAEMLRHMVLTFLIPDIL